MKTEERKKNEERPGWKISPIRVPSTDIFNAGVGVSVCRCVGVVLAVNGDAVEGSSMSNDCALNRSRKRGFRLFYVLLCLILVVCFSLCYDELSNCPFVCVCGIRVTRKANLYFMYLLWIIKFFCIYINTYERSQRIAHSYSLQVKFGGAL